MFSAILVALLVILCFQRRLLDALCNVGKLDISESVGYNVAQRRNYYVGD